MLVGLSALTVALGGLLALGVVISAINLLAAAAVIVLLTLPEASRWFARPAEDPQA